MAIKIFVDQGHNPRNPNAGAEAFGVREQDINYAVGVELANLLRADPNFEVLLSRNSPEEILGTSTAESLRARVDAANNWGADAFISIHANASNNPEATGSEAYVYSLDDAAAQMAESYLSGLTALTGELNRGVFERPSLYVLRRTAMPAVLLELGYLTNQRELQKMVNNPELYAKGIYDGIKDYYGIQ